MHTNGVENALLQPFHVQPVAKKLNTDQVTNRIVGRNKSHILPLAIASRTHIAHPCFTEDRTGKDVLCFSVPPSLQEPVVNHPAATGLVTLFVLLRMDLCDCAAAPEDAHLSLPKAGRRKEEGPCFYAHRPVYPAEAVGDVLVFPSRHGAPSMNSRFKLPRDMHDSERAAWWWLLADRVDYARAWLLHKQSVVAAVRQLLIQKKDRAVGGRGTSPVHVPTTEPEAFLLPTAEACVRHDMPATFAPSIRNLDAMLAHCKAVYAGCALATEQECRLVAELHSRSAGPPSTISALLTRHAALARHLKAA